jgi:signal transduction histidine kinase
MQFIRFYLHGFTRINIFPHRIIALWLGLDLALLSTSCSARGGLSSTGVIVLVLAFAVVLAGVLLVYGARLREIEERSEELAGQLRARRRELERRNQELETLYAADQELYRYLELDQVLQALVDKAVDILEADKGSLMVWDQAHEKLVIRATRGFHPETVARVAIARGQGVAGMVAQSGEPAIVEYAKIDPRVTHEITDVEGIQAFMQVPIKIGGEVFGVFSADYLRPRGFKDEELRLLVALAQRAAMAIENAQHYAQAQELAALEERQRLARDLHDAVSQTLFSASLIAEALPEVWERDAQAGSQLLDKLRQLSRGALAEMRALLMELRPAALAEASMRDLLRQLGQAVSGREGIPVQVEVDEVCEPPGTVRLALYRIAQEALNNVVKHAGASRVEIRLWCPQAGEKAGDGETVELYIQDDGCGFDASAVSQERFGLGIMHERAASVGARLQIESQAGAGTRVSVLWAEAERKV